MSKYDYFVSGRWRNRDAINEIVKNLRNADKTVFCFTENSYDGHGVMFDSSPDADPEAMISATENLPDWKDNPTFRKIFETDMQAQRDAEIFIMVFPAGHNAHMELGAAYGMGKRCFGIGKPDKTETLYFMFDEIYPNVEAFLEAQVRQHA